MTFNEKGNMLTQGMLWTLSVTYQDFPASNLCLSLQESYKLQTDGLSEVG